MVLRIDSFYLENRGLVVSRNCSTSSHCSAGNFCPIWIDFRYWGILV